MLKRSIESGSVEVALHGYAHRTLCPVPWSEFRGLGVRAQREKIGRGKAFLEDGLGIKITAFIPPWQSYDADTQTALEALGFTRISASLRFNTKPSARLKYLPSTITVTRLRETVERARNVEDAEAIIVCLAHPFDFTEAGDPRARFSCADFRELLDWLADQQDVAVVSPKQLSEAGADLSGRRLLANRRLSASWAPPFFLLTPGLYVSTEFSHRLYRRLLLFYAMVSAAGFALSFTSAALMFRGTRKFPAITMGCLGGVFFLLLAYGLRDLRLGWITFLASLFILGAFLGAVVGGFLFIKPTSPSGADQ